MSLSEWVQAGWLVAHQPTRQELADLLAVADRDLKDCRAKDLSADWRLGIAYNAGLQLAVAALAACGYRASREAHHYRVIQSLVHTIGSDAAQVNLFDKFRKKRNIGGYERAGTTSDQEAKEMIELAQALRKAVVSWLAAKHPDLS